MNNLLDHVKWLRRAVLTSGGDLLVTGDTMQALVRRGTRSVVLHPRFLTVLGGEALVTPQLHDESEAFLGWLPYGSRPLPFGPDSAELRTAARSLGLNAPELFDDPASGSARDVVVTRPAPGMRRHVDGPFRAASERPVDAAKGERHERFVAGDLVRAWFWDGVPLCAEREVTPFVVGDGVSSLRELIARRAGEASHLTARDRDVLLARSARVLGYHGHTLTTVLPLGAKQRIEVGYGVCPPLSADDREVVLLRSEPFPAWLPSVKDVGVKLLGALPQPFRSGILFTVDAVLDDAQQLWVLQMNANPAVHPLCYPSMIEDIIGVEPIASSRAPARAATGGTP